MAGTKERGFFVSSKDIPTHSEKMGVWVPWRFKRSQKRKLLDIRRKAQLKPTEEGYIDNSEADKQLVGLISELGIRWNWTDEDGKPLPQPTDDPNVWDEISDDELVFIVAHLEDATTVPPQKSTA